MVGELMLFVSPLAPCILNNYDNHVLVVVYVYLVVFEYACLTTCIVCVAAILD